ncbi:hypothetical protein WMW72_23145 [Paenibacillus filicis]|uniref:Sporulation lipoprotein YhcN/YlaJ (Spore_YhcN_YlaJ) n=1 Tax=Paenibacillus filicis TaxID=669464 RepID=A0ABU9DPL0_9BACL
MLPRLLIGWLGLMLFMLPVLTACQSQQDAKVKAHSSGGALGIVDANPNNPLGGSYRTYESDMTVMQNALNRSLPQLQVQAIRLNGTTAHIRLLAPSGTADAELQKLQQEAVRVLAADAPRYEAKVTVERS